MRFSVALHFASIKQFEPSAIQDEMVFANFRIVTKSESKENNHILFMLSFQYSEVRALAGIQLRVITDMSA